MSTQEEQLPITADLEATPEFELECLFDDTENPSEVTVFTPKGEDTVTQWITIDLDHAIPLPHIR